MIDCLIVFISSEDNKFQIQIKFNKLLRIIANVFVASCGRMKFYKYQQLDSGDKEF